MRFSFTQKIALGRQFLYSVVLTMVTALICLYLQPWLSYRVVALLLLLQVSVMAVLFDLLPVLVAAALSAFAWEFLFVPPRFNLHVNTTEDSILVVMYFVIASINGVLTYKIRQAEKITRIKEERSNSVQLYNTILDSLSHELRTPVASIVGAADNLQMNPSLHESQKKQLIDEISKASMRLNQQIENLLNLSRLESGHIAPKSDWTDISEMVYEVVRRVEENEHRRKIDVSVREDVPLCFTDKGMLDQVVYNLLNNAAIHTHPEASIEVSVACYADLLQIVVADNGDGFSELERKQAFTKFSRNSHSRRTGSGLGLSIVKGFTEALGGSVELEAGTGGARFNVTVPVRTSNTVIA